MAFSVPLAPSLQPPPRERVSLLGTPIDRVELPALGRWLEAFLASGTPHQVVTANLDFLAIARRRPHFARVIEEADLVICDGKPLQWVAALQGDRLPARVTGMQLVMETARLSAARGYRIFLLGAAQGVAARAARELERLVPGVAIAGTYAPPHGPFDPAEDAHIVSLIQTARTDALFVAFGAPRQDEWIAAHQRELEVALCAGVGSVFNFLAGEARRAPEWIQRWGLEWAFRLAQEPARLWRRYLVDDLPLFFALCAHQAFVRLGRAPSAGRSTSAAGSLGITEARIALSSEIAREVEAVVVSGGTPGERAAMPIALDIIDRSTPSMPRIRRRLCR